ncbi:MAG: hypothetical protein AAGN64_07695, partial [Bacteroidota bacterium]
RLGQRIPGLPEHLGFLRATWTPGICSLAAEAELVGAIFADDANAVQADPAALLGARAGCRFELPRRLSVAVQAGLRNALGVGYELRVIASTRTSSPSRSSQS